MIHGSHTSLLCFGPRHVFGLHAGFSLHAPTPLARSFPFCACALRICPHSSVHTQYRNLNLLSIGYASRPRLRPRLTRSRSALLRKPWIFGRKDSHLPLATHSSILSSCCSTAPYGTASPLRNAPLPTIRFLSFGVVFQPRTFSAQDLSTSELLRTL